MEETIREIATWLRFIGRERSARTSGDREKITAFTQSRQRLRGRSVQLLCETLRLRVRFFCLSNSFAVSELLGGDLDPFAHEPFGVLLQDAAVLNDFETCLARAAGGLFVDDAFLHPDDAGSLADGALHNADDAFR